MTERTGLEPPADATAIRDEQVARALRRLDERGELTPHQRAVIERLADRLTAELVGLFDADERTTQPGDTGERLRGRPLSQDCRNH